MATKTAPNSAGTTKSAKEGESSGMQRMVQSQPVQDLMTSAKEYARRNPEAAALWCFGIGFVLAWKIKPW